MAAAAWILLTAVLWAAARPAPAIEEPASIAGTAVETEEDDQVRRLSARLAADSGLRGTVADRILASSLARVVSASEDPSAARGEAAQWIQEHPEDAARLELGFAGDDRKGTHDFETSIYHRVVHYFRLNPNYHGLLDKLTAAGSASRSVLKQTEIPEEEQRELIKHIFEGTAGETSKILTGPDAGSGSEGPTSGAPAAFAGAGIYDRLSAANPTGYSPQVLEYQNALNGVRAPGAPRLSETGKLDEATLEHPYYYMRYDLERLQAEPSGPAEKATSRPEFARAMQALAEFRTEALIAKNPTRITPVFLRELGRKQKEAARWITAAWLEEDLKRLRTENGFWSKQLQDSVRSAPEDDALRQAYLRQGERLRERLERAESLDQAALSDLTDPAYADRWIRITRSIEEARTLRRDLDQDIRLFAAIPPALSTAYAPEAYWHAWLRRWAERLAPGSRWTRCLERGRAGFERPHRAFAAVASGSFVSARNIMLSP